MGKRRRVPRVQLPPRCRSASVLANTKSWMQEERKIAQASPKNSRGPPTMRMSIFVVQRNYQPVRAPPQGYQEGRRPPTARGRPGGFQERDKKSSLPGRRQPKAPRRPGAPVRNLSEVSPTRTAPKTPKEQEMEDGEQSHCRRAAAAEKGAEQALDKFNLIGAPLATALEQAVVQVRGDCPPPRRSRPFAMPCPRYRGTCYVLRGHGPPPPRQAPGAMSFHPLAKTRAEAEVRHM